MDNQTIIASKPPEKQSRFKALAKSLSREAIWAGVKKGGKTLLAKLGIKAGTAAAGAAATAATTTAAGAAAAPATGGLSLILTTLANIGLKILGGIKSLFKKVAEKPQALIALGIGLGALGFLVTAPLTMILWVAGGSLLFIGGVASAPAWFLGAKASLSSFFSQAVNVPGTFFSALGNISSVGLTFFIIAILAGLGVITFFQVILTSSAFILKEKPTELPIEPISSPYIELTKTVSPKNQFENSELPTQITYNLTIKATQGKLLNVRIEDRVTVSKENNSPQVDPRSWQVAEIGDSFTQAYSLVLERGKFEDSLVTNSVTVTADIEGGPVGEQSFTIAAVQVGKPPAGCFQFAGNWTQQEMQLENQAIATLFSASTYQAFLCTAGQITLERNRTNTGYGGYAPSGSRIVIYNLGVGSFVNTLYTLAHESGHIFAHRNSQIPGNFYRQVTPQEDFLCSYPLGKTPSEDFAETIAVYVTYKSLTYRRCGGGIDMPESYPLHYEFAQDEIFGGFAY